MPTQKIQRRWKAFEIGGVNNFCVYVSVHMLGGSLGMLPQEKFAKLDTLRLLLRPHLAQSNTTVTIVTCMFSHV